MDKQLLEQALKALEDSVDLVREDYENAKKLYGNYPSRQARLLGMEDGLSKHEAAITAIKQALAAPVPVKTFHGGKPWPLHPAPVQEPVAHCEAGPRYCQQCLKESLPTYGSEEVRKLREVIASQAKIIESNKPPPWWPAVENILKEYGMQAIDFVADFNAAMKSAAQRQWVGLTDEQKLSLEIQGGKSDVMLAELVEGWLKEKNT